MLTGPRVTLRSTTPDDAALLDPIRNEPEVLRWWSHLEPGEMDEFVADEHSLVIEVDGEIVGAVQYGEEEDPMYRHANIDVYLTAGRHGEGLGSEAVRVLARYLLDRGHHRLTIDPAAANRAAIRAYEKVGFRPVGVLRSYEQGPDGSWHDGLLMELLAGELIDDAEPQPSPSFESIFPIVSTRDLPRLLGFYEGLLDGEISYRFPSEGSPAFVTVRIGSDEIGIAASDEAPDEDERQRASLWVYADDCDAAVEHLRSAAVTIVEEPSDQPWGERTARVLDPDGNEVIVGSRRN
jgi:aminoglycoside 6'-N-acetyltransferase